MGVAATIVDEAMANDNEAPTAEQFLDEEMQKVDFLAAPDLRLIAERIIAAYPELAHLRDSETYPIVYLWKRDGGMTGGKATLGKCTKASGLVKHFSEATWVIWLAANHVNDNLFSHRQVEALLYHELSHAFLDEDGKPSVLAHDFTGFMDEVKRYGDWRSDLKACKRAWQQWTLPEA